MLLVCTLTSAPVAETFPPELTTVVVLELDILLVCTLTPVPLAAPVSPVPVAELPPALILLPLAEPEEELPPPPETPPPEFPLAGAAVPDTLGPVLTFVLSDFVVLF